MQILVVEDDIRISDFLVKGLEESGYLVTLCPNAELVLQNYQSIQWDLMIIDIMLPQMDGRQLVQALRYKKNHTPILMLSALNTVQDKVNALDDGADDYLTKPFYFEELLSRVKALTRRSAQFQSKVVNNVVAIGNLKIDFDQYKVWVDENEVDLSPREFKLLSYLVENKNKALSRTQITNTVWGHHFDSQTNVVDVYISYLRNKLEPTQKYIVTIKGVGYMFKEI